MGLARTGIDIIKTTKDFYNTAIKVPTGSELMQNIIHPSDLGVTDNCGRVNLPAAHALPAPKQCIPRQI